MTKSIFEKQATLLLQLLSLVEKHKHFALKGGTALNFFIHALNSPPSFGQQTGSFKVHSVPALNVL